MLTKSALALLCAVSTYAATVPTKEHMPGGAIELEPTDEGVVKAAHAALLEMNMRSNSRHQMVLHDVVKASSQVVQGTRYSIALSAALSGCDKAEAVKTINECPMTDGEVPVTYSVDVWFKPWEPQEYQLIDFHLHDSLFDEAIPSGENKRIPKPAGEDDGNVVGAPSEVDVSKDERAAQGLQFGLSQLDMCSQEMLRGYRMVRTTQQIVSGIKYSYTLEVAGRRFVLQVQHQAWMPQPWTFLRFEVLQPNAANNKAYPLREAVSPAVWVLVGAVAAVATVSVASVAYKAHKVAHKNTAPSEEATHLMQ